MPEAEGLTISGSFRGSFDAWTQHLRAVRGDAEQEIEGLERRIDEGKERERGLSEGIAVGRRD